MNNNYKYAISPELESIVTERFLEFTDKTRITPITSITKTGKFIDVKISSFFIERDERGTIFVADVTPEFLNEIQENFEFIRDYFGFKRYIYLTEIHPLVPDFLETDTLAPVGIVCKANSTFHFTIVGRFTNNNI